MDFFQAQDRAAYNTKVLTGYFVLALVLILLAINFLVYFALNSHETKSVIYSAHNLWGYFTSLPCLIISVSVLFIISVTSLWKIFTLRSGGRSLAKMVGATPIDLTTKDFKYRRLLNVVEEMSIASGFPIPEVYVLEDELAINAFVAGYSPTDTILVVTKGLLHHLNREELQGVIGHEFSHIVNGDIKINIRLVGILAGILVIAKIGYYIIRSSLRSSGSSRSKNKGQAVFIGIGLFMIGYIGLFFGKLIKASISRQREYLADASAVQFTRNPKGIAGALIKIKKNAEGSELSAENAEDISHFCFGSATASFFNMLATHPPIDKRINELDKAGDIQLAYQSVELTPITEEQEIEEEQSTQAQQAFDPVFLGTIHAASKVVESVGSLSAEQYEKAQNLYSQVPSDLKELIRSNKYAKAVVYAILRQETEHKDKVNQYIKSKEDGQIYLAVEDVASHLNDMAKEVRLILIDLLLPTIKKMEKIKILKFLDNVYDIIKLDKKFSFFEFVLYKTLFNQLDVAPIKDKVKYKELNSLAKEVNYVLAFLLTLTEDVEEKKQEALNKALEKLNVQKEIFEEIKIEVLSKYLKKLRYISPSLKKDFIEACSLCIFLDEKVTFEEAEAIRAISESLDCPMPLLV